MKWRILALVGFLASTSVAAEPAITVIDGDTFDRAGYRYRIWGIDAPEARDICPDGYPAGREATIVLASLLANDITCHDLDRDRWGRVIARCTIDATGDDLARVMVREGFAWDWPRYSGGRYAAAQEDARARSRGIWAHGCRWGRS